MYNIKGFSTKKDVATQLKEAGVDGIKMPFKAQQALEVENNPFEGIDLKDIENNKQEVILNK